MKKFLSVLLSIIFAILLLVTLLFNIVRVNVTPSKIMDLGASMINSMAQAPADDGLYHPGQKRLSTAGYDVGDLDLDLENLDIGELVQQYVAASGYDIEIDEELIADILSDPETKDLVDNVMNQAVDYLSGKTETLDINPEKVESVVVKSITKIEEKTGTKIEYDPAELKAEIASGVEEALPAVQESLDVVKEESGAELESALKVLNFFSVKNLIIFIVVLVVIVALIGGSVGTSAVVEVLKTEYEALITPVTLLISSIIKQILMNGIITTVIGLALCITGFVGKSKKSA